MKKYNHAFDIAFEIGGSICPNGTDITAAMIREAVAKRMASLSDAELVREAVGCPWDTYEEESSGDAT